MFTHTLKKLPKNTVEIQVKISKDTVDQEYKKAFDEVRKTLAVEGFRKGNVPRSIAEKNLKKDTVFGQMIRDFFPKIYEEIVKKESLKPIISPKIDLIKAKENEDWEIKITLAEKPTITLPNYQKLIQDLKKDAKKADIWTPGKDATNKYKEAKPDNNKLLNSVLSVLLKESKIEIPDILIEEELNNRLSRLVDDVQKIGLTIDSYLKSKKITHEELKKQYRQQIIDTYKIEFILMEIAEQEKIQVEQADLAKLFANIKDEKERKMVEANSYFYATVLRKQKTLDYLISL